MNIFDDLKKELKKNNLYISDLIHYIKSDFKNHQMQELFSFDDNEYKKINIMKNKEVKRNLFIEEISYKHVLFCNYLCEQFEWEEQMNHDDQIKCVKRIFNILYELNNDEKEKFLILTLYLLGKFQSSITDQYNYKAKEGGDTLRFIISTYLFLEYDIYFNEYHKEDFRNVSYNLVFFILVKYSEHNPELTEKICKKFKIEEYLNHIKNDYSY
jgi:hypothetical protein